jgi:hypothetical protein
MRHATSENYAASLVGCGVKVELTTGYDFTALCLCALRPEHRDGWRTIWTDVLVLKGWEGYDDVTQLSLPSSCAVQLCIVSLEKSLSQW